MRYLGEGGDLNLNTDLFTSYIWLVELEGHFNTIFKNNFVHESRIHGMKLFADVSKQTNHVGSIVDVRFSVRDI